MVDKLNGNPFEAMLNYSQRGTLLVLIVALKRENHP